MGMPSAELAKLAKGIALANGIPANIFFGLIQQESSWNPGAISKAGAIGLSQVMPTTAPEVGIDPARLIDPVSNLTAGARYLAKQYKRFGSWELALMAYNGGPGTVNKAVNEAKTSDPEAVSNAIPYEETRDYWQRIMGYADQWADRLGLKPKPEPEAEAAPDVQEGGISLGMSLALGAIAIVAAVLLFGGRRG